MYEYLIDGQSVIFANDVERSKGLANADSNNLSVEFVSDNRTGPVKKQDNITGKPGFLPDAAASADVVSETTPAQNTESNLEGGSLDLTLKEKTFKDYVNAEDFVRNVRIQKLLSDTDEQKDARNRDISGREEAKFQVQLEQDNLKEAEAYERELKKRESESKNSIAPTPKEQPIHIEKTAVQKEADHRKALNSKIGIDAKNLANQFLIKDNSKTFNPLVSESEAVGSTISEMQKNNTLLDATVDYMKDQLDINIFNDRGIATETLEDIAKVQIKAAQNKEILARDKEVVSILNKNKVDPFKIYEYNLNKQFKYVANNLDNLEKEVSNNKKQMLLIKKNRPSISDGNVDAFIEYGNSLSNATEKWENSLKQLRGDKAVMAFDPYTNKRLTYPEEQALKAQGIEPVNLSTSYNHLAKELSGTHEQVKASWVLNVTQSSNLDSSLLEKPDFKTEGKVSWSSFNQGALIDPSNMSLGDMVKLRAEDGDFSGVTPSGDANLKTGDDLNKYLDNIISKRKHLNLNQAVLNDLFLFNNDYSDPDEKNGLEIEATQFLKIMTGGLIGDANLEDKLNYYGVQNFTTREKLDQAGILLGELGYETNDNQRKNFDRTFGMDATEMTSGLGGASFSFFAGNKVLGAAKILKVANSTSKGFKYVSLADKSKALLKSNSTISKAQGVLLTGIKEEAVMQAAFQGDALKGQGFGWGIGGLFGSKLFKALPKFSGRFWGLNSVAQHFTSGAVGGFVAHPFSMFTERLYQSITKDCEYS